MEKLGMINLEDFWDKLLQSEIQNNEYWKKKIVDNTCKIHLAIMVEPYLSLILRGEKTIESRFSTKKGLPYNRISKGDIVVLKKSGGDIVALFETESVQFMQIENGDFGAIRKEYEEALCLEDEFWQKKKDAKYVTLIKIGHLQVISPIAVDKKNRQSWLSYESGYKKTIINNGEVKVVCIVGKIASGKTTVASELASVIGGEQFSVSDYLKYCLKQKAIENPSRTQLQELGESFISEGWESFCDGFLKFINYDMSKTYVIDGIRHKNFFSTLCNKIYPINPILVYLEVSDEVLQQRKFERAEIKYDDKRSAEGNLADLYNIADIIFEASDKDIGDIVDEILHLIKVNVYKKIDDKKIVLEDLKEAIDDFNRNRNWKTAHNAMNLAMSINVEAAELLEIFQWSDKKDADKKAKFSQNEHLREELADILIYCINLANAYGIDISSCIIEKLQKNAKKYPLNKKRT